MDTVSIFARTKVLDIARPLLWMWLVWSILVSVGMAGESCCDDIGAASERRRSVHDEFFVATLSCEVQCRYGDSERVEVTQEFRPLEHGLLPGDGSDQRSAPWGAFTGTLEAWSRMTCLEVAADRCEGLAAVEGSDFVSLGSGSWTLNRRVLCPTAEEADQIETHDENPRSVFPGFMPVLSPFDPESGAERGESGSDDVPALPLPGPGAVLGANYGDSDRRRVDSFEYWMDRAVSLREVPDELTTGIEIREFLLKSANAASETDYVEMMQLENGVASAAPCTNVVGGRACFGDCLEFPEGLPMQQYMGTNKVRAENLGPIAVCGDNLAKFFADHQMPDSAKAVYCERFVMESLVRGKAPAVTCSSYRIRPDCSSVF